MNRCCSAVTSPIVGTVITSALKSVNPSPRAACYSTLDWLSYSPLVPGGPADVRRSLVLALGRPGIHEGRALSLIPAGDCQRETCSRHRHGSAGFALGERSVRRPYLTWPPGDAPLRKQRVSGAGTPAGTSQSGCPAAVRLSAASPRIPPVRTLTPCHPRVPRRSCSGQEARPRHRLRPTWAGGAPRPRPR